MSVNDGLEKNLKEGKFICKKQPNYFYLDVQIEFFQEQAHHPNNAETFKMIIVNGVKSLFGEAGSAVPVDALKYDTEKFKAVIRVPASDVVKIWSSMTLISQFMGTDCAIRVNKISPYLLSLSVNSRTYQH